MYLNLRQLFSFGLASAILFIHLFGLFTMRLVCNTLEVANSRLAIFGVLQIGIRAFEPKVGPKMN
jgi:hypothetical protein